MTPFELIPQVKSIQTNKLALLFWKLGFSAHVAFDDGCLVELQYILDKYT